MSARKSPSDGRRLSARNARETTYCGEDRLNGQTNERGLDEGSRSGRRLKVTRPETYFSGGTGGALLPDLDERIDRFVVGARDLVELDAEQVPIVRG